MKLRLGNIERIIALMNGLRLSLIWLCLLLASCKPVPSFHSGDYCSIIGKDPGGVALAAPNQQDYKTLLDATSGRDFTTLEKLLTDRRMFALASGVKIKVLDADGSLTNIVVFQGRNAGEELWLGSDRLRYESAASSVRFAEVWKPDELAKAFDQLQTEFAKGHYERAAEIASQLVLLVPEENKEVRQRVMRVREAFYNVAGTNRLRQEARNSHSDLDDNVPKYLRDTILDKPEQNFGNAVGRLSREITEFNTWMAGSRQAFSQYKSNSTGSTQTLNQPASKVTLRLPVASGRINLKKGDTIVLPSQCNLYFYDKLYRVSQPGEKLQVIEYRTDKRRLYLLSKDKDGNTIALNIPDQE